MVNSGSFDSGEHGDRNAKAGFTRAGGNVDSSQSPSPVTASSASLCKPGFSQTADSDLPSIAHAIEPTPTKTEFNSTMSLDADIKPSMVRCSLPLDKIQGVLTTYHPETKNEDKRPAPKKLLCLYCDRTFVNANLKTKHMEYCHSAKQNRRVSSRRRNNLATTSCIYCDKLSSAEYTLKDLFLHLVNEHSNKYFACLLCEQRFPSGSALTEHNSLLHPQEEEDEDGKARSKLKPAGKKKAKVEIRNKKLGVKTSRIIKRSKRLQAKVGEVPSRKTRSRNPEKKVVVKPDNNSTKQSTEKAKSENPYPEFDSFFRVKKITDHSIDNLKINSLTFDDVFDKSFFNRMKCNIQENLLYHIDGKLFKNEESESRISNFEKVGEEKEVQSSNSENFGCELSLNAVTPVAALSLNSQFGEDFESQIEYGSKPSKKKQVKKDEVQHYKYFTRRKYQASILEHKENRDLSKLDMWTQLVIKRRQQKIVDDKKSAKEKLEYTSCDEYKSKVRREELNRILDRRGPFEDLKEEASKMAALDKLNSGSRASISKESFGEIREILNEILNKVHELTEPPVREIESKAREDVPMPSYLQLRRTSSLPVEGDIDKSDKIALICSSQETENFELPTNTVRGRNEMIELTGEWARCRMYICAACGAKLSNAKFLQEHKNVYHQNVWVQHYEFVGNQSELYRHLSIPGLGKVGAVEETVQCKTWRRSEARGCTKCGKQCNALGELHRHILECGGDWTWMLARKKCKYRPFGAKSRRKRRGLVKRIHNTNKTERTEKKVYKKSFDGPRQRPSDADTIQRMLANLPAKRSTRKLMSLQDSGIYRQRKAKVQPTPNKVKCGKVIYRNNKTNEVKNINNPKRSLNKVLTSRILETATVIRTKRLLKNITAKRVTRQTKKTEEKSEVEEEVKKISPRKDNPEPEVTEKKKKGVGKLLKGKVNLKSFFAVKKKGKVEVKDKGEEESEEVVTRSKKKKDEEKEEKESKLGTLIRTLSLKRKGGKKEKEEDLGNSKKRKLRQSFRNVMSKVKKHKTEEVAQLDGTNDSKAVPFLDEGLGKRTVVPAVQVQEKEGSLADVPAVASESKENPEVPETMFNLEPDIENLQAKCELVFEKVEKDGKNESLNEKVNGSTLLVPVSVNVESVKSKSPLVSPISKTKARKGLNDCIAMLTSKLQKQKPEETIEKTEEPKSITPLPEKPVKSDFILKIPNFKHMKAQEPSNLVLDLSKKSLEKSIEPPLNPIVPKVQDVSDKCAFIDIADRISVPTPIFPLMLSQVDMLTKIATAEKLGVVENKTEESEVKQVKSRKIGTVRKPLKKKDTESGNILNTAFVCSESVIVAEKQTKARKVGQKRVKSKNKKEKQSENEVSEKIEETEVVSEPTKEIAVSSEIMPEIACKETEKLVLSQSLENPKLTEEIVDTNKVVEANIDQELNLKKVQENKTISDNLPTVSSKELINEDEPTIAEDKKILPSSTSVNSTAISDSEDDLPLAALVKTSVVIKPKEDSETIQIKNQPSHEDFKSRKKRVQHSESSSSTESGERSTIKMDSIIENVVNGCMDTSGEEIDLAEGKQADSVSASAELENLEIGKQQTEETECKASKAAAITIESLLNPSSRKIEKKKKKKAHKKVEAELIEQETSKEELEPVEQSLEKTKPSRMTRRKSRSLKEIADNNILQLLNEEVPIISKLDSSEPVNVHNSPIKSIEVLKEIEDRIDTLINKEIQERDEAKLTESLPKEPDSNLNSSFKINAEKEDKRDQISSENIDEDPEASKGSIDENQLDGHKDSKPQKHSYRKKGRFAKIHKKDKKKNKSKDFENRDDFEKKIGAVEDKIDLVEDINNEENRDNENSKSSFDEKSSILEETEDMNTPFRRTRSSLRIQPLPERKEILDDFENVDMPIINSSPDIEKSENEADLGFNKTFDTTIENIINSITEEEKLNEVPNDLVLVQSNNNKRKKKTRNGKSKMVENIGETSPIEETVSSLEVLVESSEIKENISDVKKPKRKSKTSKKVNKDNTNSLFEDFSLVIKSKKKPSPIEVPLFESKQIELDESNIEKIEEKDSSQESSDFDINASFDTIEPMDMELEETDINPTIIERDLPLANEESPIENDKRNDENRKKSKHKGRRDKKSKKMGIIESILKEVIKESDINDYVFNSNKSESIEDEDIDPKEFKSSKKQNQKKCKNKNRKVRKSKTQESENEEPNEDKLEIEDKNEEESNTDDLNYDKSEEKDEDSVEFFRQDVLPKPILMNDPYEFEDTNDSLNLLKTVDDIKNTVLFNSELNSSRESLDLKQVEDVKKKSNKKRQNKRKNLNQEDDSFEVGKASFTDSSQNPEQVEVRRSARNSRRVPTYNENELLGITCDSDENLSKIKEVEPQNKEEKLNSEQLFDLLKSSEENVQNKVQTSFLDNLDDASNQIDDDKFNNVFENIIEKSMQAMQMKQNAKDVEKVYEFTDSSQSNEAEKKKTKKSKKSECLQELEKREEENDKANYCDICKKSFSRIENLVKHRRTITHIQKLSEIEAKEAELAKLKLNEQKGEETKESYIPDVLEQEKSNSLHENKALKLVDIINDVLNKPVLEENEKHFSDIILQNSDPDFRRYKSLGERKSFDSDSPVEPSKILEKQISLLENIIENQNGINYIDEISMSSNSSSNNRSSISSKHDSSSLIFSKNTNICTETKPSTSEGFLKPTQYEEISDDSTNLRNYDDPKLRKTLNRDEELFLECCSLLKSSSEVSNYSSKKSQKVSHILNHMDLKQTDEPEWMEKKSLKTKTIYNDYSDNSRIPTPLGDNFADDASNSNTISSNWNVNVKESMYDDVSQEQGDRSFTFEEALQKNSLDEEAKKNSISKFGGLISKTINAAKKIITRKSSSELSDFSEPEAKSKQDSDSESRKMLTKGAMKVFEGLKVSIPTEELNLEEVLNCSPRSKKLEAEAAKQEAKAEEEDSLLSPSRRNARKSKPVKNKSKLSSKLLFKINKKHPNQKKKQKGFDKTSDVYDFEETQDVEVFTKPDFKSFRNKKDDDESDNESRDVVEAESISSISSVLSTGSSKKQKGQENVTKKKCMIMGRIFKNAAKSKSEEEIKEIPHLDNEELVKTYVSHVVESVDKKNKSEVESNSLFDKLIGSGIDEHEDEEKKTEDKEKKRSKNLKNRKRVRVNSDSTDDEFSLAKTTKKRAYKKKSEDNCINLEQELKECIGVASRKSQRKCTSGKQNVLVEHWSSDESAFEALLESQILEPKVTKPKREEQKVQKETKEAGDISEISLEKKGRPPKKAQKKEKIEEKKDNEINVNNRRKRAAVNPLYHWSSSSEDEAQDLIEVKPIREDELEDDDEDRPVQHGWIVGDSPKKLVTMLAQAKGKKVDAECVKEQKKRNNTNS